MSKHRDDDRLRQMAYPAVSQSLEREFASLAARIVEIREQFAAPIVAAEEAVAAVDAMRDGETVVDCEAQR